MSDPRPGPLLQPRGPLPGTVYWRRRLLLVVGALVLVALLARSCGSDDEPADTAAAPSAPSAPVTAPSSVGAEPSGSPSASPSASASPAAEVEDCTPADIAIGLEMGRSSYPVGGPVEIPVTVSTRGEVPCRVDVGPASLQVVLLSGGDRVWARQDCSSTGSEVVTLAPGAPVAAGLTWDGDRSAPGCPDGGATARAGTYRAVVTVLGVSTPEVSFPLR